MADTQEIIVTNTDGTVINTDNTGVDVISDTTGKEMAAALQVIAAANATMAKTSIQEVDWADIALYAHNGLVSKLFDYGDQIVDTWTDKSPSEAKAYENPWDYVHSEDVELEDGEILENRPFFQTHYGQLKGVQFSNRAFLKCPDGLAAGSYYFTIESAWGNNVKAGDIVSFTLSKAVPTGGRVAGCFGAPDMAKNSWRIYVYSADGKSILETVTPTFVAAGSSLGVMKASTRNGDLNSCQEMAYGWNRWKTSAMRQYLNSTAGKGAWWEAQDEWDIAPDQLKDIPGYLSGVSDEFLAVIKPVKIVTYTNTVDGVTSGEPDITYDKVLLPSLEQRYITKQTSGEGAYFEYWKRRLGLTKPQAWYDAGKTARAITYAIENHTSPVSVRLRSASRYHAYDTWYVLTGGAVDNNGARSAYRPAPIVVI